MKNIRRTFKAEVELFLAASDMTPTAFGRAAASDPNFVSRLKSNRNFGIDIVERVSKYMEKERKARA